jgi:non-ribosomal peptide synthetase-like protein
LASGKETPVLVDPLGKDPLIHTPVRTGRNSTVHCLDIPQARAVFTGARPAASARTLLDVLATTVASYPDEPAVDDGQTVLTYRELAENVAERAAQLRQLGAGVGDRIGIRVPSGTVEPYVAILAVLAAGAAYVPTDTDDPEERAELVFLGAEVYLVVGEQGEVTRRPGVLPVGEHRPPTPEDDAWIIFTSGSTGRPKGVAITHRSAAAFVDAETRCFLTARPIGPGDRVLAGLSVAFDASCEEMWLAWRHGACLVPAPRRLVRSGAELGGWLVRRRITVVSTVPTLASLWPADCLDNVRLLIFGGEACPPEIARRFADGGREVWNTYGPTEATVVACAAPLVDGQPVRIGLPLDGWLLAVVDPTGQPVGWGQVGELVIGGVGLGRYLDPALDAERFRPLPALSWARAYRSGDMVRAEQAGIEFVGRVDDQVKIAGRRVELGEIDTALLALPGVAAAVSTVRRTEGGIDVLVGYVTLTGRTLRDRFDPLAAQRMLAAALPAALVPRIVVLPEFPTNSAGKVDRRALPWPILGSVTTAAHRPSDELTERLRREWARLLGTEADDDANFFELGGTSVAVARLVAGLREHHPLMSVSDVYQHPTISGLHDLLSGAIHVVVPAARPVTPTPSCTGWIQAAGQLVLLTVTGLRWLVGIGITADALRLLGGSTWLPTVSWWLLALMWLALFSPGGQLVAAGLGVRLLRGRLRPGTYRRGGRTHLRLWAAERLAGGFGLTGLVGTPLAAWYARLLGCRVGAGVQLHALPPVSGLSTLGDGCSVEPEVDLSGWWLDGDRLHIGTTVIGAGARVGTRSMLVPGAVIGRNAEILPGSCVSGVVPDGERWAGSPAVRDPKGPSTDQPGVPGRGSAFWRCVFVLTPMLSNLITLLALSPVALIGYVVAGQQPTLSAAISRLLEFTPVTTMVGVLGYGLVLALVTRAVSRPLRPGRFPMYSRVGWSAWTTYRLVDSARRMLFPWYASLFTPVWLRILGARVGRSVEASTVLALPRLVTVEDGAFLADDTLLAPYELGAGQTVTLGRAHVGRRGFVGNSSIVGPGREVGQGSLVAVLSDAPEDATAGASWVGRAPTNLPRAVEHHDPARTFAPPARLVVARALVELCRIVPLIVLFGLGTMVFAAFAYLDDVGKLELAAAGGGLVLAGAGLLAAGVTTAAKWLLVPRQRAGQHPLWSSFVWRNELFDVFVEVLAAPWFVGPWTGTPMLNWWLRSLGAHIGRGVWCESYWLPEPDLVHIGVGATVNRGCVLQTHLFHDRVMRLAAVRIGAGATLGPHSITLPDTRIAEATTICPGSLVMAAERVPAGTRWHGNPITAAPPK